MVCKLITFDWALKIMGILESESSKERKNFNYKTKDSLDEWIYFLKNEEIKNSFKAQGLKEALGKFSYLGLSGKQRKEYNQHLSCLRDVTSTLDEYKSGEIKGKREGRAREKEGERQARLQIALSLFKMEMDAGQISKITELTTAELVDLSN